MQCCCVVWEQAAVRSQGRYLCRSGRVNTVRHIHTPHTASIRSRPPRSGLCSSSQLAISLDRPTDRTTDRPTERTNKRSRRFLSRLRRGSCCCLPTGPRLFLHGSPWPGKPGRIGSGYATAKAPRLAKSFRTARSSNRCVSRTACTVRSASCLACVRAYAHFTNPFVHGSRNAASRKTNPKAMCSISASDSPGCVSASAFVSSYLGLWLSVGVSGATAPVGRPRDCRPIVVSR